MCGVCGVCGPGAARLPLRDALACVTAVCGGWRSLRNTRHSPLFRRLDLLLDVESHLSVRCKDRRCLFAPLCA